MNVKGYYKRGRVFGYIVGMAAIGFIIYYLATLFSN